MNKTWIQLICGACLSAAGMTVLRAAEIQVARAVNTTTNPSNKAVVSNDGKAPLLTPAPIVENELAAQDPKQAFERHLATAEKGDAEAQFQLGQCYEKGKGVELDARKAYDWYRKSAEQEHAKAQMALGGLYYLGRGVERDYEESAKWWKLAAEQNEVKAHINLANLHLIGIGVEPSKIEAYAHFNLAAKDSEEAASERDALEKKMNIEQVSEAHRRTKDLKKAIDAKLEALHKKPDLKPSKP